MKKTKKTGIRIIQSERFGFSMTLCERFLANHASCSRMIFFFSSVVAMPSLSVG